MSHTETSKSRTFTFAIAAFVIVCVGGAAAFFLFRGNDDAPPVVQGGGIYYTGPMKSKGGGGGYGTVDGQLVTEAQAKAATDQWLKDHPEANKK